MVPKTMGSLVIVRQEIDGLQAEQLEFVPCGQILQDEDNGRRRIGEAGPCPDKRETTYFSFSRSMRPSQLCMHRKAPWRSKRE